MGMVRSKTYIAIPPGATIKEQLVERGMTQKEFSIRLNMSEKHISQLINGEVLLTPEMAFKLEMVLGIPANFWNQLEAIYREKQIQAQQENEMEQDKSIARKFPYSEMVQLGWIVKTDKIEERVINLRKYFEVVNLTLLNNYQINKIACRRLNSTEKADYALLAWAQKAKLEARNKIVKKININLLEKKLSEIQPMTLQNPNEFYEPLNQLLSDCGIALILIPHLNGSYLHGVTFLDRNKIVIGLTSRGKDADKFWFSLYHELAHIIKGHINQIDGTTEQDELEADQFARESLISKFDFDQFISNYKINSKNITTYSSLIGIDPGILVGRLQKENYIPYNSYNHLKKKYEF